MTEPTIKGLTRYAPDRPIWERQPDEPGMWFDRFDRMFKIQGPSRRLREAVRRWRIEIANGDIEKDEDGNPIVDGQPTSAWWYNYNAWKWVERAETWDAHIREERLREEAAYREDARRERRAILRGMKAKLALAVTKLDPSKPGWRDVQNFARVVMEQERAEYDEEPTKKIQATGAGGGPLQYLDLASLQKLTDEQLDSIIEIAQALERGGREGEDEA